MLTRLLKLLGSLTLAVGVGVDRFRRGISQGRIQRSSASRQVAPDHASRVAESLKVFEAVVSVLGRR